MLYLLLQIPAPQRGEIVRQIGNAIRSKKELLGKLVGALQTYIEMVFSYVYFNFQLAESCWILI